MKLAIMQPYFFPYLGYFSLIKKSDLFILFDTSQFIRHGWIERNRILKPNGELLYIKVPLEKHHRETKIKDVKIRNTENWKEKILAQLVPYKKKAPYYNNVINLLAEIFNTKTESIVGINQIALIKTCEYIGIKTPIKVWSEMDIEIEPVDNSDEWALNICKELNAKTYFNPEGGIAFFDKKKFENEKINIQFIKFIATSYLQFSNNFVPDLSILDILMFCDRNEINSMIENVKLID